MAVDPHTLAALAATYATGMPPIRGRRIQRLVRREFAGCDEVLPAVTATATATARPALLGRRADGAALLLVSDGRGPRVRLLARAAPGQAPLQREFDLLKDSLPLLAEAPADADATALMAGLLHQATAADQPGIWEVRYAVTENTLRPGRISDEELRSALEERGRGWVVEDHGRVQSFAIGIAENGNVWALFVRPEAQGLGHGTRLHEAMIAWFATLPVTPLWLSTGTTTRARRFYERHGWSCTGPYGEEEVRYERANPGPPGHSAEASSAAP